MEVMHQVCCIWFSNVWVESSQQVEGQLDFLEDGDVGGLVVLHGSLAASVS